MFGSKTRVYPRLDFIEDPDSHFRYGAVTNDGKGGGHGQTKSEARKMARLDRKAAKEQARNPQD